MNNYFCEAKHVQFALENVHNYTHYTYLVTVKMLYLNVSTQTINKNKAY